MSVKSTTLENVLKILENTRTAEGLVLELEMSVLRVVKSTGFFLRFEADIFWL